MVKSDEGLNKGGQLHLGSRACMELVSSGVLRVLVFWVPWIMRVVKGCAVASGFNCMLLACF